MRELLFYRRCAGFTALIVTGAMLLSGCGGQSSGTPGKEDEPGTTKVVTDTIAATNLSKIDNRAWNYNKEDDVYYQLGIKYCEKPADADYETLSVFVPGGYMIATDNGNGTYTCSLNAGARVGDYTSFTAPVVFPVETPGYSAMAPLTEYSDFSDYTDQGFIYVHAGARGREHGAPAGVTDFKAAIRYMRYNADNIAGNMDRIFTFGMSGGGAQSALLGLTGDSAMYDPYLKSIGAVQGVSDSVTGSMCWCPITSLDSADAAYEWNMGNTRTELTEEQHRISDALTAAYAGYINSLNLKDDKGELLTLEQSADGRYQAGTYYDFVEEAINDSLNAFLKNTVFPYDSDASASGAGGMMPRMGMNGGAEGEELRGGAPGGGENHGEAAYENADDINRMAASAGVSISGTFETPQDYINALNAGGEWVKYYPELNSAKITSVAAFASAVKPVSKQLGAFDQLDKGQGENTLFGYGGSGAHFDPMLAEIVGGTEYESDFAEDLGKKDSLGNSAEYRLNMYSPLYYLMPTSKGYNSGSTAKYWRIRSGIWQSDTAVCTELNLAQALKNYGAANVDFAMVWGQKHVKAESKGDSTANFIAWVNDCLN